MIIVNLHRWVLEDGLLDGNSDRHRRMPLATVGRQCDQRWDRGQACMGGEEEEGQNLEETKGHARYFLEMRSSPKILRSLSFPAGPPARRLMSQPHQHVYGLCVPF